MKSALTVWLFPQWIHSIACLVYRTITSKFASYFLTSWVLWCVNILESKNNCVFLQVEIELSQNLPWEDVWEQGRGFKEVCSMWWSLSDLWCVWMFPVWGRNLPVRSVLVFRFHVCTVCERHAFERELTSHGIFSAVLLSDSSPRDEKEFLFSI